MARAFRKEFKDLVGSADPILRSAGHKLVPVDAHVPILDLRRFPINLEIKSYPTSPFKEALTGIVDLMVISLEI